MKMGSDPISAGGSFSRWGQTPFIGRVAGTAVHGLIKWGLTPFLLVALPVLAGVPSFEAVRAEWRESDAVLLDRNGRELQRVRVDAKVRRLAWTPLAQVSPALRQAVIESEDRRFDEHEGVDWRAAMHAAVGNLGGGSLRGASTLSMQVAGLIDPDLRRGDGATPRSMTQKVGQAMAALEMERRWSKAQILEAYLNLVTFRGELQGVAAMAHGLFGKAPHGLNRREAAVAAALLRGPNAPAPRVAARACSLLDGAAPKGTRASSAGCDGLAVEVARIFSRADAAFPRHQLAPHAARAVFAEARPVGGMRLGSTLDANLQAAAVRALRTRLTELTGRNAEDGAVVVLDNATGEVLAYVGSSGPLSQAAEVDGAVAPRQAGSTLKPFLYGLALEMRLITAASVLDDSPLAVRTDNGLYVPRNYSSRHRGAVSVRASLAGSLNVPAVRLLGLAGPDRMVERLRAAGLSTVSADADHYGAALALGSADVSLLQLTNAYRMLANAGNWSPARLRPGGALSQPRRVMDAAAAYVVGDILSDRAARATAFGLANPLETPFWSAVKTGTSKDMRDNWAIGYTTRHTVGVWVGNAGGSPMHDVSGVSGAAPVWRDIMLALNRGAMPPALPRPPGVEVQRIRFEPAIEPPRDEVFVAGSARPVIRLADTGLLASRIVAPLTGTIVALDPDIPPARQTLLLSAQAPSGARLELDGRVLGSAARPHPWFPQPGAHTLRLVGADGATLDQANFEVRGVGPARPASATRAGRDALRPIALRP